MSEVLFGDFHSKDLKKEQIDFLKKYFEKKEAYLWIDNEINSNNKQEAYGSIQYMLIENFKVNNNHAFFITTKIQPDNSYDLLYPWDKYKMAERFSDNIYDGKTDDELCDNNPEILHDLLLQFKKIIHPKNMRIFVVVGYDPEFHREKVSITEMIHDLKEQVKGEDFLDSVIYEIME